MRTVLFKSIVHTPCCTCLKITRKRETRSHRNRKKYTDLSRNLLYSGEYWALYLVRWYLGFESLYIYICVCMNRGLSCTNLGSVLCADNLWIGHILARTLFHVWHVYANWTMVHRCCRAADENSFSVDKEGWEQIFNTTVSLHQIYVQKCTICWLRLAT